MQIEFCSKAKLDPKQESSQDQHCMADTPTPNPPGNDTGIPSNVGAGLCAIFTLLGGIIFYFIEKKDSLIRHWAVEAIFFGGSWIAFSIIVQILMAFFAHIPGLNFILIPLLLLVLWVGGLAFIILWILGLIKAFQGERWSYPFISAQCRRLFPNLK
jgi:uncharacterized membrane protein